MSSPTGTDRPATLTMPGRYAPINSKPAKSRVPGMGKAFKGHESSYQSMSSQGRGKPALDTGSAYPQAVPVTKGPAS